MKRILILILASGLIPALLLSCEKSVKFSCDPETDGWAREHIAYYATSERSELVKLPLSKQRAIYAGFTLDKKLSICKEKLALLFIEENISYAEYLDLNKIIDLYENVRDWEKEGEKGDIESKALSMIKAFADKYSWSKDRIWFLLYTWMTEEEFSRALEYDEIMTKDGPVVDKPSITKGDCECRVSLGCFGYQTCNRRVECVGVESCGIWGSDECNGICE